MPEICYENIVFLSGSYSTIEDNQLDSLIQQAQQQNPNIGLKLAKGFLKSKDIETTGENTSLTAKD